MSNTRCRRTTSIDLGTAQCQAVRCPTPHGPPGKVVMIACEPSTIEHTGFGLSEAVTASVDAAVRLNEAISRYRIAEALAVRWSEP